MIKKDLNDFVRGWIVGDFDTSLIDTNAFELAIKRYVKGDKEPFFLSYKFSSLYYCDRRFN